MLFGELHNAVLPHHVCHHASAGHGKTEKYQEQEQESYEENDRNNIHPNRLCPGNTMDCLRSDNQKQNIPDPDNKTYKGNPAEQELRSLCVYC